MKNILLITAACLLVGCGCHTTPEVPAQPGWKIIVKTDAEAASLREATGNDLNHTGRVVEITVPTKIKASR